ncbi:MAG: DedA family protein [Rickettsiales bacterium]
MEVLGNWFEAVVHWLVALVEHLGVLGIFIMTFLESTFMPIPSEMTMIPAGYLIQQGKMHLGSVLVASILGTIGGAYFNYLIARHFGRGLFLRYGKYFLMTPAKLAKLEAFFERHGSISTFIGRLIPGIRHYISFPAGLAKMDSKKFLIYTAAGGALWMCVLIALGYHIGQNKELMMTYMPIVKGGILLFILIVGSIYIWRHKRAAKKFLANEEGSSPDGK